MYSIKILITCNTYGTMDMLITNAHNKFMYKYIVVKDHKVHVIYNIHIIDKFLLPFKKVSTCICCGSILSLVWVLFSFVSGYGNVW